MSYIPGYSVNMRQDKRTSEYLAVIPSAYDQGRGRYYMAYTLLDGWVELSPEYVTRNTRTVTDYPETLKRTARLSFERSATGVRMTSKLIYLAAMLALTVGLPLAAQPIFASADRLDSSQQVDA